MKKRITIVVALALVASMAFTACGNNPETTGESGSVSIAESSSDVSSEASSESTESEEAESEENEEAPTEEADGSDIAVYAEQMQEMLDALSEIYGDALTIETTAEGDNTLVITYTLLNDSLGLTAEMIKTSMEAEASKMETIASQMESGGISSPVIVVKWIDTDGSELFNQEYK